MSTSPTRQKGSGISFSIVVVMWLFASLVMVSTIIVMQIMQGIYTPPDLIAIGARLFVASIAAAITCLPISLTTTAARVLINRYLPRLARHPIWLTVILILTAVGTGILFVYSATLGAMIPLITLGILSAGNDIPGAEVLPSVYTSIVIGSIVVGSILSRGADDT